MTGVESVALPVIMGGVLASTTTVVVTTFGGDIKRWSWKKHGCMSCQYLTGNFPNKTLNLFNCLHDKLQEGTIKCAERYALQDKKGQSIEIPRERFFLKDEDGNWVAFFPLMGVTGYIQGYECWTYCWFAGEKKSKARYKKMKLLLENMFHYTKTIKQE